MDLITFNPRTSVDPSLRLRSPGQVLLHDYLVPQVMNNAQLARRTGIPVKHIKEIILASRPVSANQAIRLAAVLGTTEFYWLLLQARYDLAREHGKRHMASSLVG
jgi:addiction module HigA family antidote